MRLADAIYMHTMRWVVSAMILASVWGYHPTFQIGAGSELEDRIAAYRAHLEEDPGCDDTIAEIERLEVLLHATS